MKITDHSCRRGRVRLPVSVSVVWRAGRWGRVLIPPGRTARRRGSGRSGPALGVLRRARRPRTDRGAVGPPRHDVGAPVGGRAVVGVWEEAPRRRRGSPRNGENFERADVRGDPVVAARVQVQAVLAQAVLAQRLVGEVVVKQRISIPSTGSVAARSWTALISPGREAEHPAEEVAGGSPPGRGGRGCPPERSARRRRGGLATAVTGIRLEDVVALPLIDSSAGHRDRGPSCSSMRVPSLWPRSRGSRTRSARLRPGRGRGRRGRPSRARRRRGRGRPCPGETVADRDEALNRLTVHLGSLGRGGRSRRGSRP